MFRTILVPIDGSPFSERALREAVRLLADRGGRIELLAVLLDAPGGIPHVPKLDRAAEQAAEAYLSRLAEGAQQAGIEVEVGYHVRWGAPAPTIVAAAQELGADLVVMASHGVGAAGPGAPSYGLGGVTFKVLHDAHRPVLVLPIRPGEPAT